MKGVEETASKYVMLARLYALGERLQALSFQNVVLGGFSSEFADFYFTTHNLENQYTCDLLQIACEELPDRAKDPLRKEVFWYAASRLEHLQQYPAFVSLLDSEVTLGKNLCLQAANSKRARPKASPPEVPSKFEPENLD